MVQGGRNVRVFTSELEHAASAICQGQRQAQIGAGEVAGVRNAMASELTDAKKPIRD